MKVLFVCWANAERSQVAEYFFNKMTRKHSAFSAGAGVEKEGGMGKPPGKIVSEIMLSMGHHDLLKQKRKQLTKNLFNKADRVIILQSKIAYPIPDYAMNSPKVEEWYVGALPMRLYKTPYPSTHHYHIRMILNERELVRNLIKELG